MRKLAIAFFVSVIFVILLIIFAFFYIRNQFFQHGGPIVATQIELANNS